MATMTAFLSKYQKSLGHIGWAGSYEFLVSRVAGEWIVSVANRINVLDSAGQRHSRWECTLPHFLHYFPLGAFSSDLSVDPSEYARKAMVEVQGR